MLTIVPIGEGDGLPQTAARFRTEQGEGGGKDRLSTGAATLYGAWVLFPPGADPKTVLSRWSEDRKWATNHQDRDLSTLDVGQDPAEAARRLVEEANRLGGSVVSSNPVGHVRMLANPGVSVEQLVARHEEDATTRREEHERLRRLASRCREEAKRYRLLAAASEREAERLEAEFGGSDDSG
ncbi:MAG: hypothetical protein EBT21_01285 [Actinobacteria bacterium]|nr:hypothetical protein [Actinomycetota bacterium]